MKVVICGAGQVGFHLARYLSSEQNDVTVVDQSPELIGKINDQLDVQAFVGHAAHPDVLERAGAENADMLIAVTFTDEVNMTACQVAHSLFNVPTKIARIRQQNYLNPMWGDLFAREHLPIDVIISPEKEVARAIGRRLRAPGAFDILPMGDDKVRVIGVRCTEDTPVINTPLRQLTSLFPDLNIVVIAILRDERMIIPTSNDQMLPGDEIYFVADKEHVSRAMAVFGHEDKKTRRIIIVGGGNIGTFVAKNLEDSDEGYSVRIIEQSKARARIVAEELPTTNVILGDGLDSEILEEANIHQAETIISVTDDDETNILSSLLAKRFGVERAVTLVNKNSYAPLITTLGIDVVVSPREITASTILQHVRRGRIRSVHSLRDGFAEIIEAEALATSPLVGKKIKEAKLPKGILVGAIVRGDEVIIPRPSTDIQENDIVIMMVAAESVRKVEKMFAVRLEYF
ncbi:Trk system potassium transporter TrkA [Aestuariispira insulae]|uniref:Trk system potassium uptake protein TrkA n=1 Tax=Aestuariispira insulae TaxID=1461337 RepID=A0A3D9HV50_9PROT|nr:Trk system potassium transporter TrkA [Aestuariispira insulae]RED53251.1 trk system potassium uptake protein TrkA [Aestuariispira insulae]